MGLAREFSLHSHQRSSSRSKLNWKILIIACALFLVVLASPSASAQAQTQQPFLVAVGPVGAPEGTNLSAMTFTRDDSTGALVLLPNTTVTFAHPCAPFKLGFKELLLFDFCGDGLSMYTLDGSTGIVAEVPTSPFAASTSNFAALIAPESTGQYVYLLKANFSGSTSSNNLFLDTFQIDQQHLALVPTSSQTLPVTGAWVSGGAVADPNGHGFAVLLNQDQGGAQPVPVLYMVTFDPSSGLPLLPASGMNMPGINASSIQITPKGQFMAVNFGANSEILTVLQLSTSNFQVAASNSLNVGTVTFPGRGILFDPSGTLLYVQVMNPGYPAAGDSTNFLVFDVASLTELPVSPITIAQANDLACGVLDPYGPFVYCENATGPGENVDEGIAAYQVDPITGAPTPVANSPFYPNLAIFPRILTATASQQSGSTPALGWSPSTVTFSSTTAGKSNGPQIITLKNVGTLPVTISSTAISGPNATDFSRSDQCSPLVVLQPSLTCTISITYTPANPGTSQAALVVTDDAAGSPQSIALSGTAVAPVPAVTLNPTGSFNFSGTTTQGTIGAPQNVGLMNSGDGILHVTNIVVTGLNANDFVLGASNCLGTVAPSANCNIPITFAPLAAGIRTTTLSITDDAPDSPQTLTLNATATPAVVIGAAPSGSTSATISAGQTAQFSLQITPGAGYTGTVSLIYSGAPLGAAIQGPSTLQIVNGNAAPFMVSVTTSGGASGILPFSSVPRSTPFLVLLAASGVAFAVTILLLLVLGVNRHLNVRPRRLAFSGAFSAILFLLMLGAMLGAAGCGGGSAAMTTPPQIVTPQGQSTIIVTPSAMSANGKPLQLQPIQLMLTVN
jgi:hypothetical protein